MNCNRIGDILDAFAEGELDSSRRRVVEEHLKECSSCRTELSAIRRTIHLLAEVGEVDEPPDFLQQVRQRIEARRKRGIFERLLLRPALARAFVGMGCVLLAGFGIWLAIKHLFPTEETEKYAAAKKPEATRMAFAPRGEKESLSKIEDEISLRQLKTEEKVEGRKGGAAKWDVDQDAETVAGEVAAPAVPAEEKGSEFQPTVVAKAPATSLPWERTPTPGAEEESRARTETVAIGEGLSRNAPLQEEAKAGAGGVTWVEPPAKELAGKAGREVVREREEFAREKAAAGKEQAEVTAGAAFREERVGVETKGYAERAASPPPDEDQKQVAMRHRTSSKEGAEIPADTPGAKLRPEEALKEGDDYGHGALAVQKPSQEQKDASDSAESATLRLNVVNGALREQQKVATGQPQVQTPDTAAERYYFFGTGNFVAGYDYSWKPTPELVLFVRDKEKARSEIEKIVRELGGSLDRSLEKSTQRDSMLVPEEPDSLVVTLKPGTYQPFRDRLPALAAVADRGGRPEGPARGQTVEQAASFESGAVTLVIRLVEISHEDQQQPPPQ